jgi:hypothetical protein
MSLNRVRIGFRLQPSISEKTIASTWKNNSQNCSTKNATHCRNSPSAPKMNRLQVEITPSHLNFKTLFLLRILNFTCDGLIPDVSRIFSHAEMSAGGMTRKFLSRRHYWPLLGD